MTPTTLHHGPRQSQRVGPFLSVAQLVAARDDDSHPSLLLILVIVDVEVTHLVRGLVGGHDAEEIPQLLRLQVLLAQILQVALGERSLSGHMDLGLLPGDGNLLSQVSGLAVHFDATHQELLKVLRVDPFGTRETS